MWYFMMKNSADVRTLGICCFKMIIFAAVWEIYPMLPAAALFITVFIQTCCAFCVATLVHNAMHCDVFSNNNVEFIWRLMLAGIFGFPVEAYKPTHNANHHVYTENEKDHLNCSQMKYRWHFLNLIMFFPTVFPALQKLEGEYLAKEYKKRSRGFFSMICQMVCAHGFTIFLFWYEWRRALFCWFLPNVLGVDGIITMNLLQHDGCEAIVIGKHRGSEMEIDSARNFVGPVINWTTCNNGFHSIHHMYSNTHWTQYPELHKKLIEPYLDSKFAEQCIVRYLFRTFFYPGILPEHRRLALEQDEQAAKAASTSDQSKED